MKLFVHARNVTGLGAAQVVGSLIRGFVLKGIDMTVAVPYLASVDDLNLDKDQWVTVKGFLPNALFRIVECVFPKLFYPSVEQNIILGDIPLRGLCDQIVLVHQSHLIKPSVNTHSSTRLLFKVMRALFEWNLGYVKYIVVQSGVMQDELLLSYPQLEGRIKVIPQPAPDWFSKLEQNKSTHQHGLSLFYPAAGYPHKKHILIADMEACGGLGSNIKELIITLRDDELVYDFSKTSKVRNIGRLSPQECISYYQNVDALFFPSVAESYGLPLVEAMIAGLPILCADLPYAHWMCGDEAIYFDPEDVESAAESIRELQDRLIVGWKPDWTQALSKLPASWDDVAQEFIELLK